MLLFSCMVVVEDKNASGPSYVEVLVHIHRHIQMKMSGQFQASSVQLERFQIFIWDCMDHKARSYTRIEWPPTPSFLYMSESFMSVLCFFRLFHKQRSEHPTLQTHLEIKAAEKPCITYLQELNYLFLETQFELSFTKERLVVVANLILQGLII